MGKYQENVYWEGTKKVLGEFVASGGNEPWKLWESTNKVMEK